MNTLHINLISDQIIPNLIPTFSDTNCVGTILVFGDDKLLSNGDRIKRIYKNRNIPVLWTSYGESSHQLTKLNEQAKSLLKYLTKHHLDKRWVLNATCGTKPMSLAMTLAFYEYNAQLPSGDEKAALIIYTDTQNKAIPVLNENMDFNLPYRSVLSLEELLSANGFTMESAIEEGRDDDIYARAELTEYLCTQFVGPCASMLGSLQYRANKAYNDYPNHSKQVMDNTPNGVYADVYSRLAKANLINWQAGSKNIEFCSLEACRYLAGLWLEEVTYLQAKKCSFEEVAMSVEGVWTDKQEQKTHTTHDSLTAGNNNEFDILIRHKNQLLTIECKAKNWGAHKNGPEQAGSTNQDTMHKLDNLGSKLGGLFARNLLVSATQLTDAMTARAQSNRIKVCECPTPEKIKNILEDFFTQMD